MKNLMFFGTSILEGFGEAFGRVLGGKNRRFSHFFRYFLEANFEERFESEKIDQKSEKSTLFRLLASGLRCRGAPGERKREGLNTQIQDLRYDAKILSSIMILLYLIQHASHHLYGGAADWKPPGGDTAGHPLRGTSPIAAKIFQKKW